MSKQAQYEKDYRERMKAKGFRQLLVWVHNDDRERLKAQATLLRRRRGMR